MLALTLADILPQDEPTPPPPPSGRNSTASTLDSAIALLRRGLCPDGTYEGVPEGEVAGYQWRTLHDWAEERGLVVPEALGPIETGGREHDLLNQGSRWIKFTKPFCAGYIVEIVGGELLLLPATPLQYLRRWKTSNRLFGDSVEFLGMSISHGGQRLVISQPDIAGDAPTWDALHTAFTVEFGFRQLCVPDRLLGGYESRAYVTGRFGVFDVRPQNCVIAVNDVVVPIDVIAQTFNRDDSSVLQSLALDE